MAGWTCTSSLQAALTPVQHETFQGTGTVTSGSPDSFSSVTGTFTKVPVGARPSTVPAPGWSADLRNTTGSINWFGKFSFAADTTPRELALVIRVKSYGGNAIFASLYNSNGAVYDVGINASGYLFIQLHQSTVYTSTYQVPLNTWTSIAFAWQYIGSSNLSYKLGAGTLGGSWNAAVLSAASANNYDTGLVGVSVGMSVGGVGAMYRLSCPSLYTLGSLATDFAFPSDIILPAEQSTNWYVNPATGNDANDGLTPATAWQTATKLGTESQYMGLLDSNATGAGNGDVVTIDTSTAPLPIGTGTLTFATQGLKVQPAAGQAFIRFQAEKNLTNSAFTATSGSTKTFQTSDTQANVVLWENDKWMWHVKSASYGAAATITNPPTGVATSYASTIAALDATPGSFYTDGTTFYVHPFGDTNPATDGKTYTRSVNRGGGLAAVAFTAGNFRAIGFDIWKTCLVDSGDNDFGAYCLQSVILSGGGFSNSIENCRLRYGDKHCLGLISGETNSTTLILNVDCEQGHPYCGYGGQTPFVSFSGGTTADVVHVYRGCACLTRSGLIGSTAGDPEGTGGDIILSHGAGSGTAYSSITLDGCNFAMGSATMSNTTGFVVTGNTRLAGVVTYCPTTTIQQSTLAQNSSYPSNLVQMLSPAAVLMVQNCIIKPTWTLSGSPAYYGFLVYGNATIQGCTLDVSGITGDTSAYFYDRAMIVRTGALNLTYRDNLYLNTGAGNLPVLYGATNTDTLPFDHNAFELGGTAIIARAYNDGTTTADRTLAQWQALGKDTSGSFTTTAPGINADYTLQPDSPLIGVGLDFGPAADYTGAVFQERDDIGAFEYVAPPDSAPATYGAFVQKYFPAEQDDPTVSGPSADGDGDGLTNLLEYAFNLDPRTPNPAAAPTGGMAGDYLTITYRQSKAATDLIYTVEVSGDLITWQSGDANTTQLLATDLDAGTLLVTVRDNVPMNAANGQRRFIRVRVTLLP